QIDRRYWLRHTIKPGLTGLAQVRGYRGATNHADDLIKRLECDMEYLSHWSLMTDITILARTLFVLLHRNAY
ncbi:MAG: sugar transferase, partial [Lysobacteraceae bacterium]